MDSATIIAGNGMTWQEYVDSSYNSNGLISISDGKVFLDGSGYSEEPCPISVNSQDNKLVLATDVISKDINYRFDY